MTLSDDIRALLYPVTSWERKRFLTFREYLCRVFGEPEIKPQNRYKRLAKLKKKGDD
jgi:hypothetical protein